MFYRPRTLTSLTLVACIIALAWPNSAWSETNCVTGALNSLLGRSSTTVRASGNPLPPDAQFQLWRLADSDPAAAARLRTNIERQLTEGDISSSRRGAYVDFSGRIPRIRFERVGGGQGARLVTFPDGTRGIWKPMSGKMHDGHAELAAYEVDRLLGTNMVPVTVRRRIGNQDGTIQLFVENADEVARQASPEYMRWFDTLLRNADRHANNYLTRDGRTVAIDHGLSFREGRLIGAHSDNTRFDSEIEGLIRATQTERTVRASRTVTPLSDIPDPQVRTLIDRIRREQDQFETTNRALANNLMPPREVYDRLTQVPPEQWRAALQRAGLNESQINQFIDRRQNVLAAMNEAKKFWGDSIFRSGAPRANSYPSRERQIWDGLESRESYLYNLPPWASPTLRSQIDLYRRNFPWARDVDLGP